MSETTGNAPAILFVDDEATAVKYFQRAIGSLAPVLTAGSVDEGRAVLDAHAGQIAVLVSDQRMPGAYGNELLAYARERYPHIVRILTTAYSELDHTVEAVNQGQIHRYLQKPWEIVALRMELRLALELAALQREHGALVRDKLQAGQRQLRANRIGALHTLCASLVPPEQRCLLEASMAAALALDAESPAPDWRKLDYAQLVAHESARCAALRDAAGLELARFERLHPGPESSAMLGQLATVLEARLSGSSILLEQPQVLGEFLAGAVGAPLPLAYAGWLAGLAWLARRGASLAVEAVGTALHCRLVAAPAALDGEQLADWIER